MTRQFHQHEAGRRGALLLLVLGVLTLFMMIGTLMLVLATRTRDTARAFAAVTSGTAAGTLQSRAVLDEALLVLIRGVADEGRLPAAMRGQSLLEDRYGRTTTAVAVAGSVVPFSNGNVRAGPLLQASLRDLAPAVTHPCDLNGRIVTFMPAPDDGDVVSYRILRTIGTAPPYTVFLANTPGDRIPVLPKKECRAVINGREFLDEPHDAFSVDPWLTRPTLADSRVSAVPQAAYGGGGAAACDNDGDGVADGVWLPGVVVDRPSPRGGTFSYEVSYLVLDLDGRLNVNAHGTAVPTDPAATWQGSANVPVGLGYGPADVDLSQLLAAGANTTLVPGFPDVAPSTRLRNLVSGATAGPRSQAAADNPRRPAAFIGTTVEGRYGPAARPGTAGAQPPAWLRAAINGAGATGMSPTDLQARAKASSLRTAGVGGPPALTFFVPSRTASDLTENPYMLRLDAEAPRVAQIRTPGGRPSPADNPFTLAELERVLRPFDGDAQLLPQRLATLLDEYGERCRLTTTTDSWDTPALAGDAMRRVEAYMRRFPPPTVAVASLAGSANTATVYDVVSPDVSAGLRFDVNRPLEYPEAAVIAATELPALKERYCRHLFTLLVALGQPANAATAQWVVNACDFRDTDSTMTRFRFDTDPTNGWAPAAGDVVVGVERPEVVITETVAWSGAAFAVLYHPWDARLIDAASVANPGTNAPVAVEQVDPALRPTAAPTANEVAINLKNGAGNSVWRLRVEGGATLALGDALAAGANDAACRLGPNAYLLVQTADSSGTTAFTAQQKLTAAGFNPGGPGAKRVFLERLADPAAANVEDPTNAAFNPYVVVDVADMEVAADQGSARKKRRSEVSFWRPTFVDDASRLPARYAQPAPWFHWPNRPFVSVAELALVPRGTPREALENFALPTGGTAFPSLACDPAVGLLDAVHVPSRFQGTSFRVGGDAMLRLAVSAERMATTQLPRWREPGRINVNTILPSPGNTVAGAQVAELNDAVWKGLARGGPATNPFTHSAPADSFTKLLALSTTARPPVVDTVGAPRDGNPFFAYATAIRLANTATIRSHVFAVWITLKVTDTSAGSGPPTYARLFAIVDRSIPVGFSKGDNMNVRDTIRLQRILE